MYPRHAQVLRAIPVEHWPLALDKVIYLLVV